MDARVKSISERSDRTFCITVEMSNGEECKRYEFILIDELFATLDIEVGDGVADVLDTLDSLSKVTAAFISACSSFAYTQSSLRALYRKLVKKGFSKETSVDAIELVRSRGFVDEADIAQRRAELMLSKLWGRGRIMQKLREEGFPQFALEAAAATLEDVDFSENCATFIKKKYGTVPEGRRERERMYAALMRSGFTGAEIKRAISSVLENE